MTETKIDLSKYHNSLGRKHQMIRLLWSMVWGVFARPLPEARGADGNAFCSGGSEQGYILRQWSILPQRSIIRLIWRWKQTVAWLRM